MLKIGVGAGFSGDRMEAAEILLNKVDLDYIVFECLAERTIALAQQRKLKNKDTGYDVLLEKRIRSILPVLIQKKVRLITNMGAANPIAGGKKILEVAKELNIPCKIAVVTGDSVLDKVDESWITLETGNPLSEYKPLLSANAYVGIEALLPALDSNADIIITGRVADPSLFLAPQVYHYGWSLSDYRKLGQGTVIGHLLECGGQVSGGYFADSMRKKVPNLAQIGFPYAEIGANGDAIISKAEGTGGIIDLRTVKEQLLYEVHDPNQYITPDVIANFTSVQLTQVGENKVSIIGGNGKERPESLKVSVGYQAGYLGEGEISYAGTDALGRAELAKDILHERLENQLEDIRIDLIGMNAIHRKNFSDVPPYEVRVRATGRHREKECAALIGEEVEALYLNGPAGGGGARKNCTQSIGIISTLISREKVEPQVEFMEWK
ncbi:acyclic terpene utilization AtuA family protein [Pseudogracilibacillus sp. SE30717A]|uniref:acyclic terpene utilization AtuA family protein n=1 Tax=Pseudogracilibacillus sp. SE30717A TaxID=3098293 RepID=UPI00300DD631